jgi:carbonic anhydrase
VEEKGLSVIDTYLENNAKYADGFSKAGLASSPAGEIAIVVCMDARLNVGALLGISEGDAHVLRNAGGIVTDDVIRSLMISQRLLGTREIMLVHHTDCGMQKFTDDELKEQVRKEIGVEPPFAIGTFPDLEEDVRQSKARIEASPFVPHKDAIRGFVYEVETGRLREVK